MIRLGIIGTGSVSGDFARAAKMSNKYELSAICSRDKESAKDYAKKNSVKNYFYNDDFFASDCYDVCYICTPNVTHHELAIKLLQNGKNVIVEKPAFANYKLWKKVFDIAFEKKLFVFEASRHLYDDNFDIIRKYVFDNKNDIKGARFSFAKYSSKFDDYLEGNVASSLSSKMAGGAMMDLGLYLIYASVVFFGMPNKSTYYARKILDIDISGTAILQYDNFDVSLYVGKNINNYTENEIYFSKKTMIIDSIPITNNIKIIENNKSENIIKTKKVKHYMIDEVEKIAHILENKEDKTAIDLYEKSKNISCNVIKVLDNLRKSANIVFPIDL